MKHGSTCAAPKKGPGAEVGPAAMDRRRVPRTDAGCRPPQAAFQMLHTSWGCSVDEDDHHVVLYPLTGSSNAWNDTKLIYSMEDKDKMAGLVIQICMDATRDDIWEDIGDDAGDDTGDNMPSVAESMMLHAGFVEALVYLQRGAGGFLFPLELGRLCDETLLKDVLFQNEPNTLTGLEVETCSVSFGELMMCVRKADAKLRLRSSLDLHTN
ncbi:MAG: hypothetical protein FRX49_09246 [Trebouxia sp. A1-2]|nr:MAG: hypothetical protein FRX49_09246 [Trebouxia sp. A1-2]